MKYAFPILTQDGKEFADSKALNGLLKGESGGHYLLGGHSKWHGGIHISEQTAPWCKDKHPVRSIADGRVVAFRMMPDYLSSTFQDQTLKYSNCFCLVEHAYCETNPDTKEKNEFTFYSLYMHLLPWDHHQQGDKLVLKVGRNVRNSVPHLHPTPEELLSDEQLPSLTLPAGTEFERVAGTPTKRGTLGKTDYNFVLVKVLSPGRQSQQMLAAQGDNVWLAMDEKTMATIKPQLPNWLYDQVEAELATAMAGRADPIPGEAGELPKAGAHSVSLPAGTRIRFDAHQQEFQQSNGKSRKMARCSFETPAIQGGSAALCGMAWVCVEDEYIKVQNKSASHLGELYVLPSPLPIAAGDTIGYLGLVETPTSLVERDAKKSIHQLHLEVFSQDPKLADVLANKAQTKGGASYAKVPAGLTLAKKSQQANAVSFTPTETLSQEVLLDSPKQAKDNADIDWIEVMTGLFVQQSKVEMLSQHDWLKIGFQQIDGSGSDGHLAPEAPSPFFLTLAKAIDPKREGEWTSADVHKILQDKAKAETIQKLIVKHPSEWYEKSASPSYQWLDKLMAEVGLPEFDKLVDHEKQRIDSLEWMQSAAKLKLGPDLWHIYPLINFNARSTPTQGDARVRAFMRMLRVGEGTVGDIGYETLFSGKSFIKDFNRDFSDHPRIKIKAGGLVSSAAGAYQIMGYTWDDSSMVKARSLYGVQDFSPLSQDTFCLIIFKKKRPGCLDLIRQGKIVDALDTLSYEWASLPPGRYGQPSKTIDEALKIFNEYLEQELNETSDLYIPLGATNEF
ncbi:glycoside hydrolase family 24 protein [Aeromonas rivuli]|uniref:glycoside hydrolase family 24 protein n=1 Tax=Aeromonas rivuli TaxID=648794 RepID=UPI001CCF5F54|nr:glycoside hydrolase family 104 protein [Aeromonas rivuli]UBO74291.1 glycoside hydrolase family 104 protein [Aeromonas rivuli]